MKILYVIPTLGRAGAERLVVDTSMGLMAAGHEVRIAILNDYIEFDAAENVLNVRIIHPKVQYKLLGKHQIELDELNNIIREFQPDIIHSHLYEADVLVLNAELGKSRHVMHVHSNLKEMRAIPFSELMTRRGISKAYERRLLLKGMQRNSSTMITISDEVDQFVASTAEFNQLPRFKLYNATDTNLFRWKSRTIPQPPEIWRFISVGRLTPIKNHKFMIDAMKIVRRDVRNFELDIYGIGSLMDELKDYSKELGLQDNIQFKGIRTDIEHAYREAHLYLHTAAHEPFGLVLIEAMASGLPVVSCKSTTIGSPIRSGVNGLIPDQNTPEAFAELILKLMQDDAQYHKLSKQAIESSEDYSIDHYVSELIEIYSKTLEAQ